MNTRVLDIQRKLHDVWDHGLAVDGFWGRKSTAACQAYLRSLMPHDKFPADSMSALVDFYGKPWEDGNLLTNLGVEGLGVRYDGVPVKTICCHWLVASPLSRVLTRLSASHPEILRRYEGCYNDRAITGGSRKSCHAFGIAIDFASSTNANNQHWPTSANMPLEVMETFAREGFLSAGAFWSRDAMHFQATA